MSEVAGLSTRSLFSHRPGERFVYQGSLFTRIVISDGLAIALKHFNKLSNEQIESLQDTFFAVDQHGVMSIFTRDEDVVTISTLPDWEHPSVAERLKDPNKVLIRRHKEAQ